MENSITILYQADCAFCALCRVYVEDRDPNEIFTFKDIRESNTVFFSGSNNFAEDYESIVVIDKGVKYTKFPACLRIALYMKSPWPTYAKILGVIPTGIGHFLYDLIAKYRWMIMKVIVFLRK